MRSIYFDYNATTPLDPAVRDPMLPFLGDTWGNPSSIHQAGRKARACLDEARERSARVLACKPSEIVFTSGGTESVNLAILGTVRHLKSKGRHLVTSAIEHHAVLRSFEYLARHEGFDLTVLPVDREGRVSPDDVARSLRPDTVLASVMAANNEIGTLQPVPEIGALCRSRGILFHTDAVQWFGKEPVSNIHQFNADLVSICAHKFHGPKGAGALFIRSPLHPDPILFGGSHENERRAGTENLAGIIGFVEALERFVPEPVFARAQLEPLTRRLIDFAEKIDGVRFVGSRTHRLSNTAAFVVDRTDGLTLLAGLDLEGVCASSGSACSAGSLEPSHVVAALGFDSARANALLRFSLGRESTADEVAAVESVLPGVIRRAQRAEQAGKIL
ncbi:MAG: cysteine desulfurase family protein [Verrucomicrobiota bacterium]